MRVRRSRLLYQSLNKVALYFDLEAQNRACVGFSSVHFTENEGHQKFLLSPWDWEISPKLLEMESKLVKMTLNVRRSRLLFQSPNVMGLYFGLEARNRGFDRFTSFHFTENQGHHKLNYIPRDWKISLKFLEINPKLVKLTLRVRRSGLLFQS